MKPWMLFTVLACAALALAGCGADTGAGAAQGTDGSAYAGSVLQTAYEGAVPAGSQLALGTLALEGTENAVTPDQARTLLPLWQALQSGVLQSDLETNTVYGQIERAMTEEQLAAIAAMQLTAADMDAIVRERGLPLGAPVGERAAEVQGAAGPFGNMSDEERAAMRATAEAGGMGFPGGGPRGNLTDEQRAAMQATAEAGDLAFPGRPGGGTGQAGFLARPVVELLAQRAAE